MLATDLISVEDYKRTDQGFLVFDNSRLARVGIQEYRASELAPAFNHLDASAIVRIYRPPEEVFAKDALASIAGKPITIRHHGMLDSKSISDVQVGHVGDSVEPDGDFVKARTYVTSEDGVRAVERGLRQLSVGWRFKVDMQSGTTPKGEAYDAIAREIRGNHVALVERGRCGSECRVHDEVRQPENKAPECACQGAEKMGKKIEYHGIALDVSDEAGAAFVAQSAEHSTIVSAKDAEIATLTTTNEELETKLGVADANVADLTAKLEAADKLNTPEALDAAVKNRAALVEDAGLMAPDLDCSKLATPDIKRAVLEAMDINLDGREAPYVEAAFDARAETARETGGKKAGSEASTLGTKLVAGAMKRATATDAKPNARTAHMESMRTAHLGGSK